MAKKLDGGKRSALREAGCLHPDPDVRARALWILWLDRGIPLARIARASKVSRPTVYRYLALWERFGQVEVLATATARRVAPWRHPGQGRG